MIPILFEHNASSFNTNGLGRLTDTIECLITEQRNGQYELYMTYPLQGAQFDDIRVGRIIAAKPYPDKPIQAFDIYSISKPFSGIVEIYARHISYRLSEIVTTGASIAAQSGAAQLALNSLKNNAILADGQSFSFNLYTDVMTVAKFTKTTPTSVRARLGGSEGSMLDQYGGEFEWDNFDVYLKNNRGADNGVTIRYSKNMTDLTDEESNDSVISGCVGYFKNDAGMVVSDVQYASNAANFDRPKVAAVDFTSNFSAGGDTPTKAALNGLALIYVNRHNTPKNSIKVSFIDLAQTDEYKDYIALETVHLCDYVSIYYPDLGVNAKAKVIKTEYNVLEERYKSIEIGEPVGSFFETVTDSLASEIESIGYAAINATAWLTNGHGYVVAIKNDDGTWKELLFMDTNDVATAHNVLRINENGFGFSTTGVNGTYTNAWTIDGHLVADFIDTGTLNAAKATIINLNASNISTGYLSADRIAANSIAVSKLTGKISNNNWEINLDNGTLTIGNISANNINAGTLSADRIAANSIAVSKLTGSIQNGSWKLDLDSGTFTIGTISADNITAGTIDASEITVTNINANNITAGTIDASEITITNLDADNITAGTLSDRYGNTSWNLDTGVLTSENFTLDAGNLYLSSSGLIRSGDDYGRKITLNDGLLIGYYENDERVRLDLSSLNFIIDFKSKFDDTLPSYFGIKYDGSLKFWVEGSETWCTTKMYTQAIDANGMVDAQGGFAISGVTGKDYNINLVQSTGFPNTLLTDYQTTTKTVVTGVTMVGNVVTPTTESITYVSSITKQFSPLSKNVIITKGIVTNIS